MPSMLICMLLAVLVSDVTGYEACGTRESACLAGTSCHPRLLRCVPEALRLDRPSFFLGCGRSASDCHYFGFDYDASYHSDGVTWCDGPDNVRCISQVAPPVPKPSSARELHLATYNVWERPFWITMDGQRERTCRIPRELNRKWPQIDVITFQEVFMGGCVPSQASLRDLMTQHGFPYHTRTVTGANVLNGGVWLASRWPIVKTSQLVFQSVHPATWDFFSSKGVIYAKVEKTVDGETMTYHIMGTHMQAGGGDRGRLVRQEQASEWAEWVAARNIPPAEAVLYAGDFNVHSVGDPPALVNMTATLRAVVPPLLEDEPPVTDPSASIPLKQGAPTAVGHRRLLAENQIDYTMYSDVHLQPVFAVQRYLNPEGDEPFPICWCPVCPWPRGYRYPDDTCTNVVQRRQLSDHRPIYGKFIF